MLSFPTHVSLREWLTRSSMTAPSRELRIRAARSLILTNRRAEDKDVPMIHGRVIVARARAIRSGFRERTPPHPCMSKACGSVTAPGPVVARDRAASYRRSPPRCRTKNNKDSTHNVQGRARGISHSRGGCARPRRAYAAHDTQYAPY